MAEPNSGLLAFCIAMLPLLLCCLGIWFYRLRNTSGDKRFVTLYQLTQYTSIVSVALLAGMVGIVLVPDDGTPVAEKGELYGFIFMTSLIFCLLGSCIVGNILGKRIFVYFAQHKIGRVRAEQICRNEKC